MLCSAIMLALASPPAARALAEPQHPLVGIAAGGDVTIAGGGPGVTFIAGRTIVSASQRYRIDREDLPTRYVFGVAYQASIAFNVVAPQFGYSVAHRHRLALPAIGRDFGLLVTWGPELTVLQGLRWARMGPGVGLSVGYVSRRRRLIVFLDGAYGLYVGGPGRLPPGRPPVGAFGLALRIGYMRT